MPTTRPRHAITETASVQEALDELRREQGSERVQLGELVILGAKARVAELRGAKGDLLTRRRRLTDRIRAREPLADLDAAEEVRRHGWVRPS